MNCSLCTNPRRKSGRYCLIHHAQKMRESRSRNEQNPVQRAKSNARSYANTYLRRGKLKGNGCEKCGEKAQMHHEDYSKPLEVTWLCRKHHMELHAA